MNPTDDEPTPGTTAGTDHGDGPTPVTDLVDPLDLARIGNDLDGVEIALRRLDDGTYWTDEVTGDPIPDEVLATDPVARRFGA